MALVVELCGEFAVELDGRPLDLRATARQGRLVVAYLALCRGRPVTRDELLDSLWPDSDLERASAALSQTLARVRRAGVPLERLPNGAYRLQCELDLDPLGALLPGDEGEWLEPHRRELRERSLDALEQRARSSDPVAAEALARRIIADAPDRESAWALLMEAQAARGNPTEATKTYHELRAQLREAYGTTPSQRLVDLHAELLSPPRRSPRFSHELPNRTIGREAIVTDLTERLHSARLVTVTGFGGVGKTRVALEVARRAEDARFVALAMVAPTDDVAEAIAAALEIQAEPAAHAVLRFLAPKRLLLVLDNCEHLPALPAFVRTLLDACPGVTVLATSREPLTLAAEQRYPLPTLDEVAAVALFADRAAATDPAFVVDEAVLEICRRVEGLPLAIELAAARCGLLSPAEIAERLDSALAAPALREAPARQQTLRATIDWSYELLSAEEQSCFTNFAVFAGGATLAAAEAVGGGDLGTYERLVAKSLLARRPGRLTMLATVREHARERLDDATRERHYRHYLALAERHGNEQALYGADRRRNLAVLEPEHDNFNAALEWASGADAALTLCAALRWYWLVAHRRADTLARVERALALPGGKPALRAAVLHLTSHLMWPLGRLPEFWTTSEAAERIARETEDPWLLTDVLSTRSAIETDSGDPERGDALAAEALRWAEATGDEWTIARALYYRARAATGAEELRTRVDAAAARLERAGNLNHLTALLSAAAYLALCLHEDADARAFAARALPLSEQLADPFQLLFLSATVGLTALFAGDIEGAREAFAEHLRHCRELAVRPAMEGLAGLAAVAVADGDPERAARLAGAAEAHRHGEPVDAVDARRAAIFEAAWFPGWDAAYAAGAQLSFAEAIDYALNG